METEKSLRETLGAERYDKLVDEAGSCLECYALDEDVDLVMAGVLSIVLPDLLAEIWLDGYLAGKEGNSSPNPFDNLHRDLEKEI